MLNIIFAVKWKFTAKWYFPNPWCVVYCYCVCVFFFLMIIYLLSLSSFFNMFYSGFHFSLWDLLRVVCECWRSWGNYLLLQRATLWRFEDVLLEVSWLEKSLSSSLVFRRQSWPKAVLVERWPIKLFLIGELILTDSFEVSFLPFFPPSTQDWINCLLCAWNWKYREE